MKLLYLFLLSSCCMMLSSCRREPGPDSLEINQANEPASLPFTSPSCNPITNNYLFMQYGTSNTQYYINDIYEYAFSKNAPRTIRLILSNGGFVDLKFKYKRYKTSANYNVKSGQIHFDDLGENDVIFQGSNLNSPNGTGSLTSNTGGTIHVEYSKNSGYYGITACSVPMTFTLNSTGATQVMNVSFQVWCN